MRSRVLVNRCLGIGSKRLLTINSSGDRVKRVLAAAYSADAPKVLWSVAAKRSHGIDGGRGARGNPRGDERHGHEQRRGPSNRQRSDGLDAKEQAAEHTTAIAAPSPRIIRRIAPRLAPSASRMPSSFVRWLTEKARTPATPTVAIASARSAN